MFRFLLIIFFSSVSLAKATVPKSITDTVVLNPVHLLTPNDAKTYIQSGVYYGGPRSKLAADTLLTMAAKWQIPIHNYQMVKRNPNELQESYLTPGTAKSTDDWQLDAYSFYQSCASQNQDKVDEMNTLCGTNCDKSFMLVSLWGTLEGMDWKKDGIVFSGCGVVSVQNSDQCFSNFPTSCTIHFETSVGNLFSPNTIQSGLVKEFGIPKPKTRAQLIQELHEYAQTTHQPITIPSK